MTKLIAILALLFLTGCASTGNAPSGPQRIADALQKKQRYERALLDNFPFAVWLKDTEGRFLAVNAEFARVFGANVAELVTGLLSPPCLGSSDEPIQQVA